MPSAKGSIAVPPSELPTFKFLAGTEVAALCGIHDALLNTPPSLDVEQLSGVIAEATKRDAASISQIISALLHIGFVQRGLNLSAEEFLARVDLTGSRQWGDEDKARWAERSSILARILDTESTLGRAAKAGSLLVRHQTLLCSAQILTDVRPVFDEPAESVDAFVAFHTLMVTYHEVVDTRTISMAMDSRDLATLKEQIERAQRKECELTGALSTAGFTVIKTGGGSDA